MAVMHNCYLAGLLYDMLKIYGQLLLKNDKGIAILAIFFIYSMLSYLVRELVLPKGLTHNMSFVGNHTVIART